METQVTVAAALKYWGAQDVCSTLELMDENIVYQLYLSHPDLPFGGETRGRDALEAILYQMLADWDFLEWETDQFSTVGHTGKAHVKFRYRHRASGQEIDGSFRLLFEVENGLITRMDEYHDRARFEAFLKLAALKPPS